MRVEEKAPGFSNPLMQASSPYLKQHARNPVYWYPWGEEALRLAREQDKPILVSIGYSTCYWCHVMEREVFENASIAQQMNRNFINIKIDREEHPQIDEIYMVARQIMTQEGGWPNNVFLTPDLKPFYAGGTFGATDSYNKPSFARLIEWLAAKYTGERAEVESAANEITRLMQQFLVAKDEGGAQDFSPQIASARVELAKHYDAQSGGFFQRPKFPHENYLQFLLAHHEITGDAASLDMAVFSLRRMAAGGINDQVGGGFHRYAVDKDWMVPHFEKMLYNQALLARAYTDAARITGNAYLQDVARSICEFAIGALADGRGAFYAAIDAENDGVEGAYYAWSSNDIEQLLAPEELNFFIHHYALADIPHFPGHKHPDGEVLLLRTPLDEAAELQAMPYMQLSAMTGTLMNKLLTRRNLSRISPTIDHKIIVGWNGLMIDALAHAGTVFGRPEYIHHAFNAADYLLKHAIDNDGNLRRCVTHGRAEHDAGLEDFAYLAKGLLSLYRATHDEAMLQSARELIHRAEELFEDKAQGGFFTMQANSPLPIRTRNGDDSTLPSANAVMAENYLTLFGITGDAQYQEKAEAILSFFLGGEKQWLEYATMLKAAMQAGTKVEVAALPAAGPERLVRMEARVTPLHNHVAEIEVTLHISDGWTIKPGAEFEQDGTATRLQVQGANLRVLSYEFPQPVNGVYSGKTSIRVKVTYPSKPDIQIMLRYFPCREGACFAPVDDALIV